MTFAKSPSHMWTLRMVFALSFSYQGVINATPQTPSSAPNKLSTIDFQSQQPSVEEWQTFMKAPLAEALTLFITPQKESKKARLSLEAMSWPWRMGWVRKCRLSNEELCRALLVSALNDSALVVRNEAVGAFAERYHSSKDPNALSILEHSYRNPANLRNGAPLFIQKKILFAINEIGGLEAQALGHRLSKEHRSLQDYWGQLTRNL